MKKIATMFLGLFCTASFSQTIYYTEPSENRWIEAARTSNEIIYIDKESITSNYFWTKFLVRNSMLASLKYRYTKIQYRYSCVDKKLGHVRFIKTGLSNETIQDSTNNSIEYFQEVAPESVGEQLLNVVCRLRK